VPRFYLKNFCNSKKKIFCYDKLEDAPFATIDIIAIGKFFYAVDNRYKKEIENGSSRVEQEFFVNPYYELIKIKNFKKLSRELRKDLFVFLFRSAAEERKKGCLGMAHHYSRPFHGCRPLHCSMLFSSMLHRSHALTRHTRTHNHAHNSTTHHHVYNWSLTLCRWIHRRMLIRSSHFYFLTLYDEPHLIGITYQFHYRFGKIYLATSIFMIRYTNCKLFLISLPLWGH